MLVDWARYNAVLFDLDGVITPTAAIHERAWAELFERWDFTPSDYLKYVDGKARYDGVQSFLTARGVDLPWGDPSDPPGDDTVCALLEAGLSVLKEEISGGLQEQLARL